MKVAGAKPRNMVASNNRKYLRDLVETHLRPIPGALAIETGIRLFMRMIHSTAVDSGQAAANWQFIPYQSSPTKKPQKIYWGYHRFSGINQVGMAAISSTVDPSFPGVGFKSWHDPQGLRPRGDLAQISNVLYEKAESAIVSASRRVRGVLVFNPITPGFPGFRPGSDVNYERNAFEFAYDEVPAAYKLSLSAAAHVVASRFRAVRVRG